MKQGIDVSRHNGTIDWDKVKASGKCEFAILRAGYGKSISQKDGQFERNYSECRRLGIPVGAYWYSYAMSAADARVEAQVFMQAIRNRQFEYPVYFDIEESNTLKLGVVKVSEIVKAFCDEMEHNGYWCGVYTSRSHAQTYFDSTVKNRYSLWLAEWGSKLNYNGEYGMWQSSDKGRIDGIGSYVDLDVCYVDYPTAIMAAGKNGYPKPAEQAADAAEPVGNDREGVSDALQGVLEIGGKRYEVTLIEM